MDDVSILMRQTNYTKEECIELLKTNTLEECIMKYLNVAKKTEPVKTTNQNIFKTIREFF